MAIYTSYYSNRQIFTNRRDKVLVSISAGDPKDAALDAHIRELAPIWDTMTGPWREGKIDNDEYTRRYLEKIEDNTETIKKKISDLEKDNPGKDVILLCWCGPGKFCHRHLAAEWIVKNFGIKVEEYDHGKAEAARQTKEKSGEPELPWDTDQQETIDIWYGSKNKPASNRWLSNLTTRPFTIDGKKYQTVEHYYQTQKARAAGNETLAEEIRQAETGWDARTLGKEVPFVQGWNKKEEEVMRTGILESFRQNPEEMKRLTKLTAVTFTHANDRSKWAEAFPRILTEVRDELAGRNQKKAKTSQNGDTEKHSGEEYPNEPEKAKFCLAIVGSRSFGDYGKMREFILKRYNPSMIGRIISGGAKGADTLAEQFAREFGIPTTVIRADWDKYGKSAGFRRNEDIIRQCDRCIAFWDGESRGTKHDIALCEQYGKPHHICEYLLYETKTEKEGETLFDKKLDKDYGFNLQVKPTAEGSRRFANMIDAMEYLKDWSPAMKMRCVQAILNQNTNLLESILETGHTHLTISNDDNVNKMTENCRDHELEMLETRKNMHPVIIAPGESFKEPETLKAFLKKNRIDILATTYVPELNSPGRKANELHDMLEELDCGLADFTKELGNYGRPEYKANAKDNNIRSELFHQAARRFDKAAENGYRVLLLTEDKTPTDGQGQTIEKFLSEKNIKTKCLTKKDIEKLTTKPQKSHKKF